MSGALAAVRGFSCVGRSTGGGGSEWCPGLDPLKGPCGVPEEDGWLCVRARGDCACALGGCWGDELGSLRLLSRCTHCLGTLDLLPCWGNCYTDLGQVNLLGSLPADSTDLRFPEAVACYLTLYWQRVPRGIEGLVGVRQGTGT